MAEQTPLRETWFQVGNIIGSRWNASIHATIHLGVIMAGPKGEHVYNESLTADQCRELAADLARAADELECRGQAPAYVEIPAKCPGETFDEYRERIL